MRCRFFGYLARLSKEFMTNRALAAAPFGGCPLYGRRLSGGMPAAAGATAPVGHAPPPGVVKSAGGTSWTKADAGLTVSARGPRRVRATGPRGARWWLLSLLSRHHPSSWDGSKKTTPELLRRGHVDRGRAGRYRRGCPPDSSSSTSVPARTGLERVVDGQECVLGVSKGQFYPTP